MSSPRLETMLEEVRHLLSCHRLIGEPYRVGHEYATKRYNEAVEELKAAMQKAGESTSVDDDISDSAPQTPLREAADPEPPMPSASRALGREIEVKLAEIQAANDELLALRQQGSAAEASWNKELKELFARYGPKDMTEQDQRAANRRAMIERFGPLFLPAVPILIMLALALTLLRPMLPRVAPPVQPQSTEGQTSDQ